MDLQLWARAVEFHGHTCFGLAMGYHVATLALATLATYRAPDEQIVAVVENDNCSVDAIQIITGCTLGKGNLIYRDYGKKVYTFFLRTTKKGIRITVQGPEMSEYPELTELQAKVKANQATPEDKIALAQKQQEAILHYLNKPPTEVCTVSEAQDHLPARARMFNTLTCHFCGEEMMEPRARVKDGQFACIPCADLYLR